jgi:tRNA(Ile)-lysidine synthase
MSAYSTEKLYATLTRLTHYQRFLVAYSGGLDSHVLLHSLTQLRSAHPDIALRAIHFHHGLNTQADDWMLHCQQMCAALKVEYQGQRLQLDSGSGKSIEEMARSARYGALGEALRDDEVVLTGHHQNDQAETLLLQLFRGAGPKGMAAMAECSHFEKPWLLRPLLTVNKASLEAYASRHHLQWIEDNSNQDLKFDRNFVRHQLLPLLQQRWPSVVTTLTRSAKHCAEASILLAATADCEILSLQGSVPHTLSVEGLRMLNPLKQRLVIRRWLEHRHLPIPSQVKLRQIMEEVLPCRGDALPKVHWQGAELRRYRDDLYAFRPQPTLDPSLVIPWDLRGDLALPADLGTLTALECRQSPLYKGGPVSIRFRSGGEYCRPAGLKMRRSLKNLFQEWGIPPWQRNRIPLIYQEEDIIQIPGYCMCVNAP